MESDYLTKALQGKEFHAHCKLLWGWMGSKNICFTRSMEFKAGVNISIIPPIHNRQKHIYKSVGLCWKSNRATMTGSVLAKPTRWQPFKFHSQSLPL